MSKINRCENLILINKNDESEVFIGCASYEERCNGALLNASKNYKPEYVIIFVCKEYLSKGKTKKYLDSMCQQALKLTDKKPEIIEFSISSQNKCLNYFEIIMEEQKKNQNITIDITTFPRQILFLLIRTIRQYRPNNKIRLLYTEPVKYSKEMRSDGWLTKGVRSVTPMISFGGVQDPMLKKMLIILTGHEGERAYITWRRHQPDKTILIPQGEPYHQGLNDIAENENQLLYTIFGDVCKYHNRIPAREIDNIFFELEKIYARYAHEYYFVVAPLGTKFQSLGFYLFAESRPDVQITYATPIHYNFEDYSVGIGSRWEIRNLNPYEKE